MAKLLCIDTSGPRGMVAMAIDGQLAAVEESLQQNQHAEFLHPAIARLWQRCGLTARQTDGVAVSNGPGSYTGLRIGLSAAKGLCYAMQKPLITLSTLELMAMQMREAEPGKSPEAQYCPMIDARRMEVYTAVYNSRLQQVQPMHAAILDDQFMTSALEAGPVWFAGSGAAKWQAICQHSHAHFGIEPITDKAFAQAAEAAFTQQQFAQLAHAEPFYGKAFYTTAKVVSKP